MRGTGALFFGGVGDPDLALCSFLCPCILFGCNERHIECVLNFFIVVLLYSLSFFFYVLFDLTSSSYALSFSLTQTSARGMTVVDFAFLHFLLVDHAA